MVLPGVLTRGPKVPVHDLAPVLAQAHGQRRPLVIFSHGLVGTRSTYSQYCSMLAAAGMIVLAIEHRDGSGPAVMLPSSDEKGRVEEEMLYVRLDDLTYVTRSSRVLGSILSGDSRLTITRYLAGQMVTKDH